MILKKKKGRGKTHNLFDKLSKVLPLNFPFNNPLKNSNGLKRTQQNFRSPKQRYAGSGWKTWDGDTQCTPPTHFALIRFRQILGSHSRQWGWNFSFPTNQTSKNPWIFRFSRHTRTNWQADPERGALQRTQQYRRRLRASDASHLKSIAQKTDRSDLSLREASVRNS